MDKVGNDFSAIIQKSKQKSKSIEIRIENLRKMWIEDWSEKITDSDSLITRKWKNERYGGSRQQFYIGGIFGVLE